MPFNIRRGHSNRTHLSRERKKVGGGGACEISVREQGMQKPEVGAEFLRCQGLARKP